MGVWDSGRCSGECSQPDSFSSGLDTLFMTCINHLYLVHLILAEVEISVLVSASSNLHLVSSSSNLRVVLLICINSELSLLPSMCLWKAGCFMLCLRCWHCFSLTVAAQRAGVTQRSSTSTAPFWPTSSTTTREPYSTASQRTPRS